MYLAFFGLAEKPFSITPDPRYLFLSGRHADALAHLVYGINEAGGFIQLTGEVGTGKTTTIRSLLARTPKNADIALILNPRMGPVEFLQTICEELGLGMPDSSDGNVKELVDLLNRYLLRTHAEGRRVVLIVDEAQNLSPEVLEQVRLLTNLETETQKLLQIILIGQPELRTLLARPDLRQLAQRVTGRYHLDPLSREETAAYVRHRLRVAGATSDIFTRAALYEIYRISGGIPRVINIICDRALLGAYTEERHEVPARLVRRAGAEVFGHALMPVWLQPLLATGVAMVLIISAAVLWRLWPGKTHPVAQRPVVSAPPLAQSSPVATPAPAATPASPVTEADNGAGELTTPFTDFLHRYRAQTDNDTAFTQLMSLWKSSYTPGKTDGCTQAAAQGLECLTQRGSFAQLRQLNRPAILILNDDSGAPYQVVLTGLQEDSAQLRVGMQNISVGIAELARYWFGDYVLLWRPASKDVKELAPGASGEEIQNLRNQLERWRGQPSAPSDDSFDSSLVQLVEDFQRAKRLSVDGVAGVETQVALDASLATPDSPVLSRSVTQGG